MAEDQKPQERAAERPTYHRDRLIAEAGDFFDGEHPHVVAGALAAVKGNKVNFTRDEAAKAVKEYRDRPVEMSYGEFTGVPDEMEEVA